MTAIDFAAIVKEALALSLLAGAVGILALVAFMAIMITALYHRQFK